MADFLQEINTIIEAGTTEAGSTFSDWPIYRSHLPDSTAIGDRAVALLNSAGEPDLGQPDVEKPGLQVITRGLPLKKFSTAYEEAETVAFAVKNALHGFSGESSSGGTHYVGIWNESGPFFLGFDESKRPLFSNNLLVQRSRP